MILNKLYLLIIYMYQSASQDSLDQTVLYHVLTLHMVRDVKDTVIVVTQAVMFLLDVKAWPQVHFVSLF